MKNDETGEFELVLGNKQLLSGFFVIVILFGVFFTMGYIVGRNSTPVTSMAPAATAVLRPQEASVQPSATKDTPPVTPPPAAQPQPSQEAAGPVTQPAREPEPPKSADATGVQEPVAGKSYLQVMAVKRPDAEVIVKTLKDKGFPALMSAGPEGLVRVLVGPYDDVDSLGRAKADLESAGVGHPIVRRY